ncbi:MAG: nucleotidyltransferase domain-containing protein [Thermosynechococcaceae cyanobacterium]
MNQQEALIKLRDQRSQLEKRFGVTRLGIFGSVARDEATDCSDLDVVVEMAPDLFMMVHLKEHLQENLKVPVDIVRYRSNMNPFLKQRIDQEAIYV